MAKGGEGGGHGPSRLGNLTVLAWSSRASQLPRTHSGPHFDLDPTHRYWPDWTGGEQETTFNAFADLFSAADVRARLGAS